MNQEILLSFGPNTGGVSGTPVPVEVFDKRLVRVVETVVKLSTDERRVAVPSPGRYLVRADLPSGENLSGYVDIEGRPSSLVLEAEEQPPHEGLAWAYVSQSVRRASNLSRDSDVVGEANDGPIPPGKRLWNWFAGAIPRVHPFATPRLFRPSSRRDHWLLEPFRDAHLADDPSAAQSDSRVLRVLRLSRAIDSDWFPLYLRIGPPISPAARLIVVPPLRETTILLLRTNAEPGFGAEVRALVRLGSPGAAALLGYMEEGAVAAARRIAPQVVEDAAGLVQQKREDPVSAAIAGYFMLLMGRVERPDFLKNLADWFTALPDGAVIYGSYLLHEADKPSCAARYLVEAVTRGRPVYTMGLRLLFDNLRHLVDIGMGDDTEVQAALAKVRRAAAYADWQSATTSLQDPAPLEV